MLSKKDWMATHRRLLAIVGNDSGSEAFSNKISGMTTNGGYAFLLYIGFILSRKLELAAKGRLCQTFE